MGRSANCSPEVTERVCAVLREGGYRLSAAASAGIGASTFRRWMASGKAGLAPFKAFREAVNKAERLAEVLLVRDIRKAEEWQAKAWLLERRNPKRWGRTDRLKVDAKITATSLSTIPLEEKARLLRVALAETERASESEEP